MAGERRRYCVGVTKIPYADRDVAHAVMTEDDPRGFFDILGADTSDDDDRFPAGSRCAYRVELTDEEAAAFAAASNCRYIHLDGQSTADGGVAQLPSVSVQQFMDMNLPGLDERWHGRDVTVAILDSGVTGQVIGYMDWTLVGRAEFQDNALRANGTTTDHGGMAASCAIPRGGRLLDAVIADQDGTAALSAEAAAMVWAADNGADVLNMSYSGPGNPGSVLTDALDYLEDHGVQAFFSTGNDNTTTLYYPAAFSSEYDNVHSSISWDTQTGERAPNSNHNAAYSGVGPGEGVPGLTPDGTLVQWSGTSASSPHMAQLCVRLCTGGTYTTEQAGAALKANTRDLGVAASEQGGGAYDLGLALDALGELPLTITTGRRNLMPNPSVELNTTGYSVATRAGITATAIGRASGVTPASGTVYGTTNITGDGSTSTSPDVTITWPTCDVTAGLEYTFTTALRHSISETTLELQVTWLGAGGDTISTSTSDRAPLLVYGWTDYAHITTAPAGSTQAVLRMLGYGHTDTSLRSLRFDATIAERAPAGAPIVIRSYFDGDSAGADWDGDAEESTSVLGPDPLEVLSTTAELVWTPDEEGGYVLRYEAANAAGSDSDDVTVTVAVPSVEGELDATLPTPTGALQGTVTDTGALAGSLPVLAAALAGTVAAGGLLGVELPALAAGLSGTVASAGAIVAQLPLPAVALAGGVSIQGELDAVLPLPVAALDATATATGALSVDLPLPVAALAGTVTGSAELDAELPPPTSALTGVVAAKGNLDATLPIPTAALQASFADPGVLDAELPLPASNFAGSVTATAELDATLPIPRAMLGGDGSIRADLDAQLPLPTADIAGSVADPVALAGELPVPAAAIAGTVTQTSTLDATLPTLAVALATDGTDRGTLAAQLPVLVVELLGAVSTTGQLDATLPALEGELAGDITATGDLDATLPIPTAALGAVGGSSGALAAELPMLTADLAAGITVVAVIHGVLPDVNASAAGSVAAPAELAAELPLPIVDLDGFAEQPDSHLAATLPMLTADLAGTVTDFGVLGAALPLPVVHLSAIPPLAYVPPLRAGEPAWGLDLLRAGKPTITGGLVSGSP